MSEVVEQVECLLSAKEVGKRYSIHEKTAWAWARLGRIPKPTTLGKWRSSEVDAHIRSLDHAEMKERAS